MLSAAENDLPWGGGEGRKNVLRLSLVVVCCTAALPVPHRGWLRPHWGGYHAHGNGDGGIDDILVLPSAKPAVVFLSRGIDRRPRFLVFGTDGQKPDSTLRKDCTKVRV